MKFVLELPLLKEIVDTYVRRSFRQLLDYMLEQALLKCGWQFFTITVSANLTSEPFVHNLGFQPKDLIQTSQIGTGTLTWNYSLFDATSIYFTTTGTSTTDPLIVRGFIGSYKED